MKKALITLGIIAILAGAYRIFGAELETPVGTWKTIDDKENREKSLVKIWKTEDGKLVGKIIKLFPKPSDDPDPICDKCTGAKKDKKINGMVILWDFVPNDKNNEKKWVNGKVLDPNNGKIYSCNLTIHEGGKSLEVRGFIGFSFIGRSQTWIRVE